jgi:hypothetical protein
MGGSQFISYMGINALAPEVQAGFLVGAAGADLVDWVHDGDRL